MKENNHKKMVKIKSIVWFISLQAVGYVFSVYMEKCSNDSTSQSVLYYWIAMGYIFFYSFPLLLSIRYHAVAAEMKILQLLSTVLIGHHIIWIFLTLINMMNFLY